MDTKNQMFYIGSHMGRIDDGYIGSSVRLLRAYKKRPLDFKRRILWFSQENSKKKLQEKEQAWLNLIKVNELGTKYYNLKRVASGGNILEFYSEEQKNKYRKKLKESAHKGEKHHNARKVVCYNVIYNTLKEAIKAIGFNPQTRLSSRKHIDFYYFDEGPLTPEEIKNEQDRRTSVKEKCIEARKRGLQKLTSEFRSKMGLKAAKTRKITCPEIGDKISASLKQKPGKKVSINGIIYDKGRIAADVLGIKYVTVKARLRSKSFPTWFYLDDPIKNPKKSLQ